MNIEGMDIGCNLPVIEVRHLDSTLEVLLISGIHSKSFMFYEVISLLEEEGAEVLNANYSVVGDKIFHTIHSQVCTSLFSLLFLFLFLINDIIIMKVI